MIAIFHMITVSTTYRRTSFKDSSILVY